jgi:DNA replication protein DnaC
MSDLSHIDFTEDFQAVLARARAKAAGRDLPDGAPASKEARLEHNDRMMTAAIERIMTAQRSAPRTPEPTPEPRKIVSKSAAEVRIGWYIPPRHQHDTLENFRPVTASQRDALQATRDWVESVKQQQGGALALVGSVGSGKSHLLYAAVREVNMSGIICAAAGWWDLADLFRRAKFSGGEDYDGAIAQRSRFMEARAFGIDEIRPTSGTDYDVTELSQLMTRAYREMQGVIVTSNAADEKLSKIIGMAASSRLTQVVIEGPDMRQLDNKRRYLGPRAA